MNEMTDKDYLKQMRDKLIKRRTEIYDGCGNPTVYHELDIIEEKLKHIEILIKLL